MKDIDKIRMIRNGEVGKVRKLRREDILVNEESLIVYRDEDQVEITVRLGNKKGLVLSVDGLSGNTIQVIVEKTINGCPGIKKPEFFKSYKS